MTNARHPSRASEAGFSMVEMLMAAFVLSIGLLGLSMLQTMSLKATRGGRSLASAVQVADRIMDQVEAEGRLSWLTITDTTLATPETLGALQWIGRGTRYQAFTETYDLAFPSQPARTARIAKIEAVGTAPVSSPKPALSATVRYVATCTMTGTETSAGTGKASVYNVTVEFIDDANASGAAVVRTVNISRSIIHG